MNRTRIISADSEIIKFCRVFCIFFMMGVHFYPYGSNPSIINGGTLDAIGFIWIDNLGRASVATLSLISGYLLYRSLAKYSVSGVMHKRWQALMLPMMSWNIIFIAAAMSLALVGIRSDVLPSFMDPLEVLNAVTGLLGQTANQSLFFIRDLFVSSILIAALWKVIQPAPYVALLIVTVLTLTNGMEPVVFRPMILLFMLAGCLLHDKGRNLADMASWRIALPVIAICVIVSFAISAGAAILPIWLESEMQNTVLRIGLTSAVLMIALICVKLNMHSLLTRYEPYAFLAYLSHVLFAKFLWETFRAMGIDEHGLGYLVYFLVTPFLVFWAAKLSMPLFRLLPSPLPQLLTGRSEARSAPSLAR